MFSQPLKPAHVVLKSHTWISELYKIPAVNESELCRFLKNKNKNRISTAFHKALIYNQKKKKKTSYMGCSFLISQMNCEKNPYS